MLILPVVSCKSLPPKPATTEYVKTEGAGFAIEKKKDVNYGITYTLLKSIGDSPSIKIEFENPDNTQESIIVEKTINPNEKRLVISSPLLSCIENDRTYQVILSLYSNGKLVSTHKDNVQFSIPSSLLNQLDLTLCNNA